MAYKNGGYQGKGKGYSRKKKNEILNKNTQSFVGLAAMTIIGAGIYGIDYIDNLKTQLENQNNTEYVAHAATTDFKPDKILEEVTENSLRNHADKYDIREIIDDYIDNTTMEERKKIKEKYGDKFICITGDVDSTFHDLVNDHYIVMYEKDQINYSEKNKKIAYGFIESFGRAYAFVNDKEDQAILENLKKDDEVTIIGYHKKDTPTFFDVLDCDIIKVNGKEIVN